MKSPTALLKSSGTQVNIAITGCGWVTPFAAGGIADVLAPASGAGCPAAPRHGYWPIPHDLPTGYAGLSGELRQDKGAWITAIAFEHARGQAAPPDTLPAERVGMVLGCALAGQLGMIAFANEVRAQSARFVSPIHFPQTVGNYVAGALARAYNIRGPNSTLAGGIASGLDAILEGCTLLASGAADLVYAGGTDALSTELALGLAAPGVILSEGACLLVLERPQQAAARGAGILATVTRCGHHALGDVAASVSPGAWVSTAGIQWPGAIVIEERVGQCFAALGAAAVAAAIGCRTGFQPVSDSQDGGHTRVVVLADADGAHVAMVELFLPRQA